MRYSFRGAAVRGVIIGVGFAVVMYPLNFGFGESVADGLACAMLVTLILYGQGRTRPHARRVAKR